MCGREETHYLIELVHLGKHRELLASFEDLFVLRSMRLLCEWVQIMFLTLTPESINLGQSPERTIAPRTWSPETFRGRKPRRGSFEEGAALEVARSVGCRWAR